MYLVFDIGGTNTRIATTRDGVDLLRIEKFSTPHKFEEAIEKIAEVAKEITADEPIKAAAGGVPAPIHSSGGMLYRPPHLPDWDRKPFTAKLGELLSCTVFIQNDTALIGLGEAKYGAGMGNNIVAFIGSGTGIGGVRIVDGNIDANRWGFEPGHHIINYDSTPDHWEAFASGSGLVREYGEPAEKIKDKVVWENFEKYMAVGLYNTCLFWSPDIVVLGGGLGVSGHLNTDNINKQLIELNDNRKRFEQMPQVVSASLGDEGGLRGAISYLESQRIVGYTS